MRGGLISDDHPWVTGLSPLNGRPVWEQNILFQTLPDREYSETDAEIVNRLGRYLASMVRRSASSEKYPIGMPETSAQGETLRRMPHAIGYIHGSSHYNGAWLVFNNFAEATSYFSTEKFRRDLMDFVGAEKRELTLVFRERDYSEAEYADFGGFLRSVLPWYSNTNGPKDLVHWGSKAPYATVNMITGEFKRDLEMLEAGGDPLQVARPSIARGRYMLGPYAPGRNTYRWPEKLFAKTVSLRVRMRDPEKGNLFFVDKRKLDERAALRRYSVDSVGEENFLGTQIAVHRVGQSVAEIQKGIARLPADFDPSSEILYVVHSDGTGHSYLVVDGAELHASVIYRHQTKVTETHGDRLLAHGYFRIKGFTAQEIADFRRTIEALKGSRTLTCVEGICQALGDGGGISFAGPSWMHWTAAMTFRSLLTYGLKRQDGSTVQVEFYNASAGTAEELYKGMLTQDLKFLAAAPLGLIVGPAMQLVDTLKARGNGSL
jgi:hypothetical protein